ncbi:TPA: UDP-2,3-diacylglucosamine diphosphatase [Neisseria meningitidis]|uniref:UDP-2,3-diacylglucosamine diphosphatase n=1 Tax=Neisseria meningitidis TaxID=487 RepID=UPI000BB5A50A|nr:UDP-2,3-diacylglucosamine diphosphatase [Neisseria meningitidis]RQJ88610.1 UDP-2,3-diacylglucosamine diphosphatase [Neisseria meningitidis]RQL23891.1 UDP-2,3-diacylglucosamine diphosphatase [Neisseria meningitidis]RQL30912.1 UDP-2,3-diacylglucosamine diphosphatase [Neisseria meningitidis]RQL37030.1 UDP-2,3-diacylglucosamine diphosphatase [Neisseria meningitidis]
MKPAYFISDLHLSEKHPELTALLLRFLRSSAAGQARAVYILGDLFDFWVGDDEVSELNTSVVREIRKLSDKGVAVFFVRGNRDFLIGRDFCRQAGMTLLPDYSVLDLFGCKTLICHGDTLCTDDRAYQRFRKIVHRKRLQKLFLMLPLKWRTRLATKIRRVSKMEKQVKPADIMDVNAAFTARQVRAFGAERLIHGHTHREHIHHENGFTRIVLGDWHNDYASILRVDGDGAVFVPLEKY